MKNSLGVRLLAMAFGAAIALGAVFATTSLYEATRLESRPLTPDIALQPGEDPDFDA